MIARCQAKKNCRGRAGCTPDAYTGCLEPYGRDWVGLHVAQSSLVRCISRRRGGDTVQRRARYPRAERSADFHTSTAPFYAVPRANGSPRAASSEKSTRNSGKRCSAAPSARRRRDSASKRWRRRRTSPQPENRPVKTPHGRAPGTRARAKFQRANQLTGPPTQASPKLFTSLCARKRAQNINSRAPATHRT